MLILIMNFSFFNLTYVHHSSLIPNLHYRDVQYYTFLFHKAQEIKGCKMYETAVTSLCMSIMDAEQRVEEGAHKDVFSLYNAKNATNS